MGMTKIGIINKNADIKKIESEEELEKFAKKTDKEMANASNKFLESCSQDKNIKED